MQSFSRINFKFVWCIWMLLNSTLLFATDVGIAWVSKSNTDEELFRSFKKRLEQIDPDIRLENSKELRSYEQFQQTIAKYEVSKKAIVILGLSSSTAKYMDNYSTALPTFINPRKDPVVLEIIGDSDTSSKITGVTFSSPIEIKFEAFRAILPNMKSICLLTISGEPSSYREIEITKRITNKLGLNFTNKNITYIKGKRDAFINDLTNTLKESAGRVDAFLLGEQILFLAFMKEILSAADKTPVLSSFAGFVQSGALIGFESNARLLGEMLADSLVDVVKLGKSIEGLPIKTDPLPRIFVNEVTAEALGIAIPEKLLNSGRFSRVTNIK